MGRFTGFALPLLARELVELSARPRTYYIRMAYTALLLVISWMVLFNTLANASNPLDILGKGQDVLAALGYLQDIGLQLVLPAIACGAFTIEKARNTLALLFLTRLGPWTILFEKFLSRLLLSVSLLIVSFPVLSFCYALGGVTIEDILAQYYGLVITAIYIVSFSILCSTWFRTTSGALLGTYALIYSARFAAVMILPFLFAGEVASWDVIWSVFVMSGLAYFDASGLSPQVGLNAIWAMAVLSVPWLLASVVSIGLARWFLVRRAFLPAGSPLRSLFKRLDRLFEWANKNSWTKGIVLIPPSERLPGDDPVAWRETTTRSLGQARYLIRIFVAIEVPVLVMLLRYLLIGQHESLKAFTFLTEIVIWIGMTLVICVLGAGLIGGERSHQTLDVLLTTKLDSRDIVQQKLAGIWRLIWICETPLWTCLICRSLVDFDIWYIINKSSILLIYPTSTAWIAMWHGLRSKTNTVAVIRAIVSILIRTLGILVAVYLSVMIYFAISGGWGFNNPNESYLEEFFLFLMFFSPVMFFIIAEFQQEMGNDPVLFLAPTAVIINSIIHGGILFWIRHRCLTRADKLFGRSVNQA